MLKLFIFSLSLSLIWTLACDSDEFAASIKTFVTTSTLDDIVCDGCPAHCSACTSLTVCTSCEDGYFLYAKTKSCQNKTKLPTNCADVTDIDAATIVCLTCSSGYWLNKSNLCTAVTSDFKTKCKTWTQGTVDVETCSETNTGYSLKDGVFITCLANCDSCTTTALCTACKSGFYLNAAKSLCTAVTGACTTWKAADTEACDTCISGYQAIGKYCYNSQCYCNLAVSTGPYPACSGTCTDSNCLNCPTSLSVCQECNIKYFVSSGTCTACGSNCNLCTDATHCTACIDAYANYNGVCVSIVNCATSNDGTTCSTCADGFFFSGTACTTCGVTSCKTCSGSNACTKCIDGNYLVSPTSCPACAITNCAFCSAASTCTKCNDGYYVSSNACAACSVTNCITCSAGATCTECKDGYFLDATEITNPVCVQCSEANAKFNNKCDLTKYWTEFPWKCTSLPANCISNEETPITGESSAKCLTCASGYKLVDSACVAITVTNCITWNSADNKCSACKTAYYLDGSECKACTITNCAQCSAAAKCIDCKAGYAISADLTTCTACTTTNCDRCNVAATCLSCTTGYSLNSTAGCSTSSTVTNTTNNTTQDNGGNAFLLSLGSSILLAVLVFF